MNAKLRNTNIASSIVVIFITIVFWLQRSYTTSLVNIFPDFVLVVLDLLAIILCVRGLKGYEDNEAPFANVKFSRLTVAVALLAIWMLLLQPLGFIPSSIVLFLAMTLFLRGRPIRKRMIITDAAISVVLVVVTYVIFARLLSIPLPLIPL